MMTIVTISTTATSGCSGSQGAGEANAAAARLDSAMRRMYSAPQPDAGQFSALSDWQDWFEENEARIVEVEDSFAAWDAALGHANPPERLRQYRDALQLWVGDQREQAEITHTCIETARVQSQVPGCVAAEAAPNLDRWNESAQRVSSLRP